MNRIIRTKKSIATWFQNYYRVSNDKYCWCMPCTIQDFNNFQNKYIFDYFEPHFGIFRPPGFPETVSSFWSIFQPARQVIQTSWNYRTTLLKAMLSIIGHIVHIHGPSSHLFYLRFLQVILLLLPPDGVPSKIFLRIKKKIKMFLLRFLKEFFLRYLLLLLLKSWKELL